MVAPGGVCGCSRRHGCSREVCMVAPLGGHAWLLLGGHAWLLPGGMCGCSQGDAWLPPGGMHGCSGGVCMVAAGGHAYQ